MRRLITFLVLAFATTLPAQAEPVRASAGHGESIGFMGMALFDQQGPSATQRLDVQWLTVAASHTVEYSTTSGATPTIEVTINARWQICTVNYQNCSFVVIDNEPGPLTAISTDPVSNTIRLRFSGKDTNNVTHNVDISLARPTGGLGTGYNPPNAWIDPATLTTHADAILVLSRYGYQASGTFDTWAVAPAPSGCQTYCNWTSSNFYNRTITAAATMNG